MIEFLGIDKSFHGVRVLRDVTFAVEPGQTLGLVGENGAGKSTLMNILGGNLRPDAGTMRLDRRPYSPRSPRDAERGQVAFIHQELNLFPNLSVAENLFVGRFPRALPWLPLVDRRRLHRDAAAWLAEVHLDVSPDIPLERLSAGERQLVEIAKALSRDARLILLDEPTTSLTDRETDRLFDLLARLHRRGISMIYISHHLGHVRGLCQRIVVLRDGAVVGHDSTDAMPVDRMVTLMVGREIRQLFPARPPAAPGRMALEVRGVSHPGIVHDVSFQIRRGEILGLAGLMGSGRSELARILFGLDPCDQGEIRIADEPIHDLPPRERIRRGLAFLTEDRRAEGLCMDASLADNLRLVALPRFARPPFGGIDRRAARDAVARLRESVPLPAPDRDEHPVRTLSGGNQQKVVLAKWLLAEPRVLILDEPTRGIDVGAKAEIYRLIAELAARGTAILLVSSELEELVGLCDRLLVLRRGRIQARFERPEFDRERILEAALHADPEPTAS